MPGWRTRAARAAGIAALLAGCAGAASGTRVFNMRYELPYTSSDARTVGPAMPVQVIGAPPDGASAEEVAAQMALPGRLGGTPAALATSTDGVRVVLAFFMASGERLCRDPGSGPPPGDGTEILQASAAFCRGARMLTTAQLRSGATRGPRDAAFRPAMLQLYSELLPTQNPERRPDQGPWPSR